MDEFENDLFENDNSAAPLEDNKEQHEQTFGQVFSSEPVEEKKAESFSAGQNPSYTVYNSDFTEKATPPVSNADEEVTPQRPAFQQNPYRNPYQTPVNRPVQRAPEYYNPSDYHREERQDYNTPKKPSGGRRALKIVVAVAVIVALVLGSVQLGMGIGKMRASLSDDSQNASSSDNASPSSSDSDNFSIGVTEASQPAALSDSVSPGILVAQKARSSVIGVVVYDVNGQLFGEGSGVIMTTDSAKTKTYIITCAHVISGKEVKSCGIMLEDGKIEQAKIVGYDERTDIGVISVEDTSLQPATFGDSTALKVGETVYAIGNPGGSEFYGSMTNGIVSALDRSISSTYTMNVIQHNAAISPGNSGGALVNSSGQVVGINSSKISATDYEGIGFAVPISVAYPVVENLIQHGYVPNRPKLGISYASVSNYWRYSAIVQSKGLPSGSVIIASIADDSSFKGTDVAVGDMITSINGKKLTKSDILLDEIEKSKVGDSIKLGICRIERSNSGSYSINEFEVTITLVEDKGSSGSKDQEETTTQSFYDYYYGNGASGDNYSSFEDFFSQFFGSGF